MSTSFERIYHARQDTSQSSPTLLPQVIAKGLANNGQSNDPDNILEVPSLTSTNNYINFCIKSSLANGRPSQQSSCSPAPMGHIPSSQNIPSTRFTKPQNGDVFLDNAAITVTVATNNFAIGNAVNAELNYLAAPQQLDSTGLVLGHYHLVVDALESFGQSSPTDPTKPIFSTELGTPSQPLSTTIKLPVGFYRISAIAHAANHQPVVVPILQHGSLNDVVYIIVQPNPSSKRSILQETLPDGGRNFTFFDYNQNKPFFSRHTKAKRQTQDPSTSLTLNSTVICSGFSQDGTAGATAGTFTPSLTSTNNFINYCATLTNVPLTNGTQQRSTDSCNSVPLGFLPSSQNMPSVKFTSPAFNDTIKENTPFLVALNVTNFVSGKSTNSAVNYLSAPQQLVSAGRIIGHTLVVIEKYSADTTPTNPAIFSFVSTVDAAGSSSGGIFTLNVSGGLPTGFYRLSSIVSTANAQPVVMPFPNHGAIDDAIFFSVTENGGGPPPLPTLSTITATATTNAPADSTSPTTASTNTGQTLAADQNNSHNTRSMGGPIAGGVIGAVLLCGIVLAGLFLWRRRKARRERVEVNIDDDSPIGLTPFEDWHGSNPSMHQVHSPPSDPKGISPPSSEGDSHAISFASTSNLVSPDSTMQKRALQSTNMSPEDRRSEHRRSNISRVSIAPSYHTTAP